jgi:hypothetical protein
MRRYPSLFSRKNSNLFRQIAVILKYNDMKKIIASFTTVVLLLIMVSANADDSTRAITVPASTEITESAEVTALIARVNEINAMDKSALSSIEKKALRKELRTIKKDVNERNHHHGGVIYISGGVILLIILLIILL